MTFRDESKIEVKMRIMVLMVLEVLLVIVSSSSVSTISTEFLQPYQTPSALANNQVSMALSELKYFNSAELTLDADFSHFEKFTTPFEALYEGHKYSPATDDYSREYLTLILDQYSRIANNWWISATFKHSSVHLLRITNKHGINRKSPNLLH